MNQQGKAITAGSSTTLQCYMGSNNGESRILAKGMPLKKNYAI